MEEKIYEEFNQPEWIQVDMSYIQKLEENVEYYKTAISEIKEEVNLEGENEEKIENIKTAIKELEGVLNWVKKKGNITNM